MKITWKQPEPRPICTLGNINMGECFIYELRLYIAGAQPNGINKTRQREVTDLDTGCSRRLHADVNVEPVQASIGVMAFKP